MNNTTDLSDEDFPEFPLYVFVIFGTVGSIISILNVFGNTLTVLSYIKDEKLHTVYNTYIFNLAIADLILGSVVLPLYLLYTMSVGSFWLGYYLCKVFYVIDFTVCVEGVFMMIIISYDRLMLLRCGVSYNQLETMTKCRVLIILSWLLAFLIYSPAIIFWDVWYDAVDFNIDGICEVQFAYNFLFTTTTAFLEFFIPLVLLAVVNSCIILEMRKRTMFRISSVFRRSFKRRSTCKSVESASSMQSFLYSSNKENENSKRSHNSSTGSQISKHQNALIKQREKRAIKSLGILMCVFLITWAPYTIYTIIKSVKKGDIELLSYEALTYFLWLKSAVNPVLYAYNSKRYKNNFKYFICCCNKRFNFKR